MTVLYYKEPNGLGFPGGASGKEHMCQCRRHKRYEFSPWGGKISWRKAWQSTRVFLPGESHRQRGLAGYSPWGYEESDTTEQLALSLEVLSAGGMLSTLLLLSGPCFCSRILSGSWVFFGLCIFCPEFVPIAHACHCF